MNTKTIYQCAVILTVCVFRTINTECCRASRLAICADETKVNSVNNCCGVGECNIFCCACKDGCRKSTVQYAIPTEEYRSIAEIVVGPKEVVSHLENFSNCSEKAGRPCTIFLSVEKTFSFNSTRMLDSEGRKILERSTTTQSYWYRDYRNDEFGRYYYDKKRERRIYNNERNGREYYIDKFRTIHYIDEELTTDESGSTGMPGISLIDDIDILEDFKAPLQTLISSQILDKVTWKNTTNQGGLFLCLMHSGDEVALVLQPTFIKIQGLFEKKRCNSENQCKSIAKELKKIFIPVTDDMGIVKGTAFCEVKKSSQVPSSTSKPSIEPQLNSTEPEVLYELYPALPVY